MTGTAVNQFEQFQRVWPWLSAAIDRYGATHSKEDVWSAIEQEKAQLHPLPHGAIVTSVEMYPSGMKELRGWLAGGDLVEIKAYEPVLCRWGRELGCQTFVIVGRRGWRKSLEGYREAAIILTKDLTS